MAEKIELMDKIHTILQPSLISRKEKRDMNLKIYLIIFCLFLGCATTKIQNPYLDAIEKHGRLQVTYWENQPPDPESLFFDTCTVVIEYPVKVWYFYIPPKFPPNDLQISITDTSSYLADFCLEFEVDGLTTFEHKTLYRIAILTQRNNTQVQLYTSLPIEGTWGLRAIQITAFMPRKYLRRSDFILIQAIDLLTEKTKEKLIPLKGGDTK